MSNMSYCRWENTLSDLEDCVESFHEGVANRDEARARLRMMAVAEELLSLYRSDREMVDGKELNAEGRGESEDEEEVESEEEVEG
jgi:hypothetical protein